MNKTVKTGKTARMSGLERAENEGKTLKAKKEMMMAIMKLQ